jgi:peroxiredoxin
VIDEEQNIIYAEVLENAGNLPNFEAISEKVK